MRLPLAPILTIFTLFGTVLSIPQHPRQHRALLANSSSEASSSSFSASSTSTSTSSSTTTTTTISPSSTSTSSTTSTPTSTPSTISTSSQSSTSTFSTSTPSPSTSTQPSSSSQESTSSTFTSQSTHSTSSTSSFAFSDLTDTSLSLPTSFTSTFASTGPDGNSFTVTAVVSRPTGTSGPNGITTARKGFFANTGAVAGTFLVVGLVGTGIVICVALWLLRKYRRRKSDQAYFDEEYREFNHQSDRNGGSTPEATLPVTRDSAFTTPVPSSPAPNMIERLHGNEAVTVPAANMYYDHNQYQAHPGEFNPYQRHDGAYGYSDHANYTEYGQYPENYQQGAVPYVYQPNDELHAASARPQAIAGPSHAPQGFLDSSNQVDLSYQGPQAH